jgi:hypothetical protein
MKVCHYSSKYLIGGARAVIEVAKKFHQIVEDRNVVQPIRKADSTHVTRFNQSQNIALT